MAKQVNLVCPEYKSVQTYAELDTLFELAEFLNSHCEVHLTIVILTKCTQ